jgi:uncharacterized membrane protein YgdD (TMEM256/DUF423 family)
MKDPCANKFQGIMCYEGRVYMLSLSGLGWTGPIPPSLGLLDKLGFLDMSSNALV